MGGMPMDILPFVTDIILLVVFASCVLDGRRKGFVKMILSVAATLAALFVAKVYAQPLSVWLNDGFVHGWVVDSVSKAISESMGSGSAAIVRAIPDYIIRAAQAVNVNVGEIASALGSNVTALQVSEQICAAVEDAFILPMLRLAAFFVIFALASALLKFAVGFINGIFKLPVIKSFNKMLGALLGAVKGVIAVAVISLVFGLVASFAPETQFALAIDNSAVCKAVSEILNLFLNA